MLQRYELLSFSMPNNLGMLSPRGTESLKVCSYHLAAFFQKYIGQICLKNSFLVTFHVGHSWATWSQTIDTPHGHFFITKDFFMVAILSVFYGNF